MRMVLWMHSSLLCMRACASYVCMHLCTYYAYSQADKEGWMICNSA